ncbi:MAG: hypothetical protein LBB23_04700 [Rickettsiales bacterium]|jgi:hypothetical protein|nr:hypothetical protein [Rickettsiales bacterium]
MSKRESLIRTLISPGFWLEQAARVGSAVLDIYERAKDFLGAAKDYIWGFLGPIVAKITDFVVPIFASPAPAPAQIPEPEPVKPPEEPVKKEEHHHAPKTTLESVVKIPTAEKKATGVYDKHRASNERKQKAWKNAFDYNLDSTADTSPKFRYAYGQHKTETSKPFGSVDVENNAAYGAIRCFYPCIFYPREVLDRLRGR